MESTDFAILSAFWLGILTSISPCPLAGNIVAISYIGKKVGSSKMMLTTGLLYLVGRMLVYIVLGILLTASILKVRSTAVALQEYFNIVIGPILIIVSLFLLKVFKFHFTGFAPSEKFQKRIERSGIWGALLLGVVLALSFCPISAALFFGSLIPLAVQNESAIAIPSAYGFGTGIPVVASAIILSLSAKLIGGFFNKLTMFEKWAARITGILFLLGGIYYCLIYIFKISLY